MPHVKGLKRKLVYPCYYPKQRDFAIRYKESEVLFVFAVIETGGKQYKVNEGDILFIEKIEGEAESLVKFDKVLAVSDDSGFRVGAPYVDGVSVEAKVVKQGKGKKIYVIKYKPKKNEKKKQGHRQLYTKIEITKIGA